MTVIPTRQYGAYTIRPKINKVLDRYLKPAGELKVKHRFRADVPTFHTEVTARNLANLVSECEIDHTIQPSKQHPGGRTEVEKRLHDFLTQKLRGYALGRNEPAARATSGMSSYLHFGQISSLEIALAVKDYAQQHKLIAAEYLEELIVRRELAFNYTRFVEDPGDLANLPDWCQKNMREHARDKRDPLYTPKQLENAETYPRRTLERYSKRNAHCGHNPWLLPDVLGEENHRMVEEL